MNAVDDNPFSLLTFLVAPSILTNASAIMVLSTSNRFGLAIDRVKSIAADIGNTYTMPSPARSRRVEHLQSAEKRVLMLVRALTALYLAVGSFVAASLVALLGAVLFAAHFGLLRQILLIVSLCAGVTGVGGLVTGSALLIHESRMALRLLIDEANLKSSPVS